LQDPNVAIVLVESEKAALALTAYTRRGGMDLVPLAMGGCWGWRDRWSRKDTTPRGEREDVAGPVADLSHCDGRVVYVLLDNDMATNPDVSRACTALCAELRKRKCKVLVCDLSPGEECKGPDDFIGAHGDDDMSKIFASARGDVDRPVASVPTHDQWPEPMSDDAFYGLAGDFVRLVLPESEADPHALLLAFLLGFGCMVGRGPYYQVEATSHFVNLFCVIAGDTSKARKGTATDRATDILSRVDHGFMESRKQSGLSVVGI
jgi:hypothetical protein